MMTIRRCHASDIPDVLLFLDRHWKRGHIFTVDRSLFEWQYAMPDRPTEYSIVIARRDSDNELLGLLGYMPTRRFDPALAHTNSVWLALWKVRDDLASGGVGLRLLSYVTEHEQHVSIGVIGFQPPVAAIYTALKFQIGELRQYVLANPDVTRFELASFARRPVRPVAEHGLTAVPLDDVNFASAIADLDIGGRADQVPVKTPEYFRTRYLLHPVYRYICFALRRADRPVAMLAMRLATHAGRHALRVVDYVGPDGEIPGVAPLVLQQVRQLRAEYADIHNWGIDRQLFEDAGFAAVDADAGDIVPNHFEPYERRHAPIRFALKTTRPAVLFKGDGDQDRPNEIHGHA
jgi:hypothetical protein